MQSFELPAAWGQSVTCRFTSDLGLVDEADALWFHARSVTRLPRKRDGQKWILMSMECDAHLPWMQHSGFLDYFDLKMTYRLDSDIPCPYLNFGGEDAFRGPVVPVSERNRVPALYIASNPVPERDAYVRELMRHMPVDAMGMCLHNRKSEDFHTGPDGFKRFGYGGLTPTMRQYKFYLAFENTRDKDYVTEKLFLPLACGSVPVYRGAGNVDEFLPSTNAAINVENFESPKRLAEYLLHLDDCPAEYQSMLDWRQSLFSDQFLTLCDVGVIDSRYRMAVKLAHGCSEGCNCGGRMRRG